PLSIGKLKSGGFIIASETCCFDLVDAEFVRDVKPGEMLIFSQDHAEPESIMLDETKEFRPCAFEYIYFARPDSVIDGKNVYAVREEMGKALAMHDKDLLDADMVIPVPDSGVPSALALGFDDVIGLSIGTRTDCITDETLDYLEEIAKTKEVWLEYGIQSVYDETLLKINRGHDFANIQEWIGKTKKRNLLVCGHLVFGLPDENQEMMLKGVEETIKMGVDSIKIHPLYVVKNTLLTNEYRKGRFEPISEEEYIDTLVKAIKMIPDSISLSRITAGISDSTLLSPSWCNNKHRQMYNIKKELLKEGLVY
ncbi:putative multi-domain containing protein, partial [Aduncisulcus paluster]